MRKFFESFGEVTGIIRKKQMLVISFKKAIAARLTGRLLQVNLKTIIIAKVKMSRKEVDINLEYRCPGTLQQCL